MRKRIIPIFLIAASVLCTSFTSSKPQAYDLARPSSESSVKTLSSDEGFVLKEAPIGDDIVFTLKSEENDNFPSHSRPYYLYDKKTKMKHKLVLPNCNNIIGRHENTLIYIGDGVTYSADLSTLESKVLCDFDFEPSMENRYLKNTLNSFTDVSDDWVYYMSLDFLTEEMALYKISISSGDIVPFPFKDDILNTESHMERIRSTRSFLYDESGFTPQRGKVPLDRFGALGQKWNGTLPTYSFGAKGLFYDGNHYGWDGKSTPLEFTSLVFSEDNVLSYRAHDDGSSSVSIYDSQLKPLDQYSFQRENVQEDISYSYFCSFNGPHIISPMDSSLRYNDIDNVTHFDITKRKASTVSKSDALNILNKKENFYLRDKKLYTSDHRLAYDFSDYDSVTFKNIPQQQGYYVNTGMYPTPQKTYTFIDNTGYYDSTVFITAYNRQGILYPNDIYSVSKSGEIVCVQKNYNPYRNFDHSLSYYTNSGMFNGKDSVIFATPYNRGDWREIIINSGSEAPSHFYLGMKYKDALDIFRAKNIDISVHTCGTGVFNENNNPNLFNFLDYRINIRSNISDIDTKFYFDEKTEKLYNINLSAEYSTPRGVSVGDSFSKMIELYGEDYKLTPRLDEYDDSLFVDCEYKVDDTFALFTFHLDDIIGIPDDVEKALSEYSKITFIELSLYDTSENTRYDNNEKFWLYLDTNCIDLTVPISPRVLDLLTMDEISILKNAYYARHGLKFEDRELSEFYETQYWYKPLYEDVQSMLSDSDLYNIDYIDTYESKYK